jgi:hypothetical protein
LSLEQLLRDWVSADADVRDAEIARHEIQMQIGVEMTATRATFAKGEGVEATMKPIVEYDKSLTGALQVMTEALDPEEIEALLTPVKPPPARFYNMVKVKALGKRGEPFLSAIEAATTELPPVLKVRSVNTQQ